MFGLCAAHATANTNAAPSFFQLLENPSTFQHLSAKLQFFRISETAKNGQKKYCSSSILQEFTNAVKVRCATLHKNNMLGFYRTKLA